MSIYSGIPSSTSQMHELSTDSKVFNTDRNWPTPHKYPIGNSHQGNKLLHPSLWQKFSSNLNQPLSVITINILIQLYYAIASIKRTQISIKWYLRNNDLLLLCSFNGVGVILLCCNELTGKLTSTLTDADSFTRDRTTTNKIKHNFKKFL